MTTIDPDTFVKSFIAQAREMEVAIVLIYSRFINPETGEHIPPGSNIPIEKRKSRRTVATNLPDAGAQALLGHLIKTDGAAVEAAARQMLQLLKTQGTQVPAFETLPAEQQGELIAGAQEILIAAANSGARKPPSGIVPADG